LMVLAEIHFADQTTFRQQRQRAINGGPGNRLVPAAGPCQQLFSGEMLPGAECGLDNGLPLGGNTKIPFSEELHKSLLGAFVACICHYEQYRTPRTGKSMLDKVVRD